MLEPRQGGVEGASGASAVRGRRREEVPRGERARDGRKVRGNAQTACGSGGAREAAVGGDLLLVELSEVV
jgi:hypothetical protein